MKLPFNLAGAAFVAVLATTAGAAAANFVTTTAVNMRAGAGANYPRITTIPANAGVNVHGCVRGFAWCDTSWRRFRGWVSGRYLAELYRGSPRYLPDYGAALGIPIITFQLGNYWDRHYRDRPWYHDRKWRRPPPRFREPPRNRHRDRDRRRGDVRIMPDGEPFYPAFGGDVRRPRESR